MTLSLLVPAYSYPSPTTFWDAVIAAGNPPVHTVIANAASGPGTVVDANYTAVIGRSKAAGIRVAGYVDTNYNAVATATVKANVDLWRTLYGVTDIFFDRASALFADLAYYSTICAYVHGATVGARVILNPGVVPDQGYAAFADTIVTFEGDATAYASYAPASWVMNSTYPDSRFANLVYNSSSGNLAAATAKSQATHAGFVYFTDDVLANPYDTLPTYFASEIADTSIPVVSSTDILNLRNIGVRSDGFIYELLDAGHRVLGTLDVNEDSAPTITNDTTRPVFRTCSNLAISSADLSAINTLKERVRISIRLQNGATFPLGVFMFGDDIRNSFSWGTNWTPALFDETFIVDQPLDQLYGIAPGQSILSLVNLLVSQVGLPSVDFSAVPDQLAPAGTAITYQAGSSRNQAITALIALLGCYPPYFNNAGTFTAKPAPPQGAAATLSYESGGRILDGTPSTTNSIYRAPNRYQVVGSQGGTTGPVGVYDLPPSAPNSYENTGIRVVASSQPSGIPNVDVANLVAYINALTDTNSYIQAAFSSTADPRHDTFDLVDILGVTMQEVAWSLECRSGGAMSHTLVGYYANG